MGRRRIGRDNAGLVAAMEENLEGHVSFVPREVSGMRVDDRTDLLIVDSGLPSDTFNKVLRARLHPRSAGARIEEAVRYFRDAGRPFAWWVGPCSEPPDLGRQLEDHGLRAAESELGMVMNLRELPDIVEIPAALELRRARTHEELLDFAAINAANWDPPDGNVMEFYRRAAGLLLAEDCPMRVFVGYVDGEPVAASELYLGGGVAGLYNVSTREAWRGRGIGRAATWVPLDAARREGVPAATLQASEDGRRVYEKLGFRASGEYVEYVE